MNKKCYQCGKDIKGKVYIMVLDNNSPSSSPSVSICSECEKDYAKEI